MHSLFSFKKNRKPAVIGAVFIVLLCSVVFIAYKVTHYSRGTTLFIPGLGLTPSDYHTLISHLQEEHYTVISYTSKDKTISNYQMTVKQWTEAAGTLIGNKKVIVIGHSVGGAVAANFCANDTRCIAGIDLDGGAAYAQRIHVPFLYIQADAGSYCDLQCRLGRTLMVRITEVSGTKMIYLQDIKHYNFTDLRTKKLQDEGNLGTSDGRKEIMNDIDAFLTNIKM